MGELDKELFETMQYTGSIFASEYNRKQERRERRELWLAKEKKEKGKRNKYKEIEYE